MLCDDMHAHHRLGGRFGTREPKNPTYPTYLHIPQPPENHRGGSTRTWYRDAGSGRRGGANAGRVRKQIARYGTVGAAVDEVGGERGGGRGEGPANLRYRIA